MDNLSLKFQYKVPAAQFLLIAIMMIGVSVALGYIATSNTKGLRMFSMNLGPDNATLFLWGLAILICIFAVLVLVTTIQKNLKPQIISIEQNHIFAPKASFSNKTLAHPFHQIKNMGVTSMKGQEFYLIRSSAGTSRLMPKSFKDLIEYQKFKDEIARRAEGRLNF